MRTALTDARDAIQFRWDQTVRGMNSGLTLGQLVETVELSDRFRSASCTTEFHGLAQHHVRQIHGVGGWFDGDAVNRLPLADPPDEARRIVDGFGGRDVVLGQARAALAVDEAPRATQLATYLLTPRRRRPTGCV